VLVNSERAGIAILATMLRHGLAWSRKGTFDSWLQARVLDYNARKVSSQPGLESRAA
jgi:hypothetical protein